jgi:ribosomal protein S4
VTKIAFNYTGLRSGNTTYGRPSIFKRRYRDNFYKKQQYRLFYGKITEETLRRIIKNHKIVAKSQTSRFFSLLESRLDMIFFRIRLLPTIYSCHQFIHHFGLELNNKKEISPQMQVKIGDIITISPVF